MRHTLGCTRLARVSVSVSRSIGSGAARARVRQWSSTAYVLLVLHNIYTASEHTAEASGLW